MSIRMAASCGHPWQLRLVPRGARTGRGPDPGPEDSLRMVTMIARPGRERTVAPGPYLRPFWLMNWLATVV